MREIEVRTSPEKYYKIVIDGGMLLGSGARDILNDSRTQLLVTDRNVAKIYKNFIASLGLPTLILRSGESEKKLSNIEKICRKCVDIGLDRSSLLIALGGGVVGDMTGFASSIYMRGISYVQIPTTVLAMVDSSVGGKTGVDLPEGKNLVGTFWQPSKVLIDSGFIKTLPEMEIRCGLAEVIKYGIILDSGLFFDLEKKIENLLSGNLLAYEEIIYKCCSIKADVVGKDEKENGMRAVLNYGHTFGHAIEKVSGFSCLSHGEAVAIGMRMAAKFAVSSGLLSKIEEMRQNNLLDKVGLPSYVTFSPEDIYSAMLSDKKAKSGKLRIIVPKSIGDFKIVEDPIKSELIDAIKAYC
ncbi:MAG TPA: 3-dehydroquinate synthase [Victivallales bacterium]|nr:3-dehydroquinate synthase [Victivallales bacterium]